MRDDQTLGSAPPAMAREVLVCWVLLLVAGVVLALFAPPLCGPDEPFHFLRSWAISRGDVIPERRAGVAGSDLPCELASLRSAVTIDKVHADFASFRDPELRELSNRLRPSSHADDCFVAYSSTAVYTPVAYIAPAIAMRIARFADASALEQLQVARLVYLFLSWLVVGGALRLAPSISWTVLAISAIPMATFLRSTHISDSLLGATSLLLVASVVRALEDRSQVSATGVAAAAFILLLKPLYPVLPLLVLVPGDRARGKRRRAIAALTLVLAAAAAFALSRAGHIPPSHGNPDATIAAEKILASPWTFVGLASRDLVENARRYQIYFTGMLGWMDTEVPLPTGLVLFTLLILIIVLESQRVGAPPLIRLASLFVIGASILFVQFAMYILWTPPGATSIEGVQGRYFLPIAPFLLLALPRLGKPDPRLVRAIGLCFVPVSLVVTIAVIGARYWI